MGDTNEQKGGVKFQLEGNMNAKQQYKYEWPNLTISEYFCFIQVYKYADLTASNKSCYIFKCMWNTRQNTWQLLYVELETLWVEMMLV